MVDLAVGLIGPQEIEHQLAHWDEDRSALFVGALSSLFVIALITVILRLAARRKQRLGLQWDDYLIVMAQFLATALLAEALLAVRYGAGIHSLRAGIPTMIKNLQLVLALQLTYALAHLTIKTSILFLYKRIFASISRPFRYAWYAVLLYVISSAILMCVLILNLCRPIAFFWERPLGKKGSCVDQKAAEVGTGVIVMVADLMILVLPMPMLWSLQVTNVKKIQLLGLFGIGFIAVTASITRIVYLARAPTSLDDYTFNELDALLWSIVEVDLGIVCACVINLPQLFRQRDRRTGASPATNTGLSSTLTRTFLLQWIRGKFGSLYENIPDASGPRQACHDDHQKRPSDPEKDKSIPMVTMQRLSKVGVSSSQNEQV